MLTLYQSTVTIVVGGVAGAIIALLAYAISALDLIAIVVSVPQRRASHLPCLPVFVVLVDIAIASILRKFLR